jgi:transcriptional regulator with XRE-family HTH domain
MRNEMESPGTEYLINLLREYCDRANRPQCDIARDIGIAPSTLSGWLNGNFNVRSKAHKALLQEFLHSEGVL